jgi:ATP/maltotriose-dependent transcriptional regulator MalT
MYFDKLLVGTKFLPPQVAATQIVRTKLLDTLQNGRRCKLTLVPASAGFGKTVLMTQWRQQLVEQGLRVAWLSLSADEQSMPSFGAHLFAALAKLGLSVADEKRPDNERRRSTDSADAILAAIVNQLAATSEDLYLFLDDYHLVEDPSAHALVQKLIELSPGNLHVAIASRTLPPLSVGRLRVMGQVSEIACDDLLFELLETRAFLTRNICCPALSADEIEKIHYLTDGWPACLQLVSIMLKNRPDRRAALGDLAWLQTYISENFLSRLPVEMVEFLETLSICRRFNAGLAAAVSGAPDAGALLRRVEDENLLIVRAESEDRSPWFRFHPLFAEFLSARLQRRGAEAVEQLHHRASVWCKQKGLVHDAVIHACFAGDRESAMALFAEAAPTAWGLRNFGPMLLTCFEMTKDKALRERFVSNLFVGFARVWAGRFPEAYELLASAPSHPDKRNEDLAIITDRFEAVWLVFEGRIAEAEPLASALYARAVAAHGRQSLCANLCALTLAEILFELNRVEDAGALLAPRLHMLSVAPSSTTVFATICKARVDLLQDSEESALALLEDQAARFASTGLDSGLSLVLAEQVRLHVAKGRRQLAADAVERLAKLDARSSISIGLGGETAGAVAIARARLLALDGEHDAALDALATARALARRLGRGRELVTTELVSARVLHAAGRPEEAWSQLVAAVERAAPLGLIRTILREGDQMLEMLSRLRPSASLSSEAASHLDLLLGGGAAAASAEARPASATVTPRQVQILGLAATGMSNKQIALSLSIAPETVKSNLKDIFSRLGVSSRYDATTWARRQGLIR